MLDANPVPYKVNFPALSVRDQVLPDGELTINIASPEVARVVGTQVGKIA